MIHEYKNQMMRKFLIEEIRQNIQTLSNEASTNLQLDIQQLKSLVLK